MFGALLELISVFATEITKKLAGKVVDAKSGICSELFRFYITLEELTQSATVLFESFQQYVTDFDNLSVDEEFKRSLRVEARRLLDSLKRFEDRLKALLIKLKLMDDSDVSIRLVKVPESSYSLFKKHFVDDLAPKFVADPSGHRYVLRVANTTGKHDLINHDKVGGVSIDLDQLFNEGHLTYEVVNFSDQVQVEQIIADCSNNLIQLNEVQRAFATLIRDNCDIEKVL